MNDYFFLTLLLDGPNEKDRILLEQFDVVITEYQCLPLECQVVIKEITKKMGDGMAEFASTGNSVTDTVKNLKEYDLYCYYVAGLVGEGLTKLFVACKLADPIYLQKLYLSHSMGLFLQKTNIIRDFREDLDDGRLFWPKDVWSKYASHPSDFTKPENEQKALTCLSELILNALGHAVDTLTYLSALRDQSVFNFCSIPQAMAMATLATIFRNKNIFHKNVKIRRGQTAQIITLCCNFKNVCDLFVKFAKEIQAKNDSSDPFYLQISVACGKIEKFVESVYPKAFVADMEKKAKEKKNVNQVQAIPSTAATTLTDGEDAVLANYRPKTEEEKKADQKEIYLMYLIVFLTWMCMLLFMLGLAWFAGARYDLAFEGGYSSLMSWVKKGGMNLPDFEPNPSQPVAGGAEHGDL